MTKAKANWEVRRHGGRQADSWRSLCKDVAEKDAREAFEKARREMRQGSLELREGDVVRDQAFRKTRSIFAT